MEAVAWIILLIFIVLVTSGVAYLVYDFYRVKRDMQNEITEANKQLEAEKMDRLSNLKFVVDQVNDVNEDIYNVFNSNVVRIDTRIDNVNSNLSSDIDQLQSELTNFISITEGFANAAPVPDAVAGSVTTAEVMPAPTNAKSKPTKLGKQDKAGKVDRKVKVNFTKPVTFENTMKVCSADDPKQCVQFPDDKGNVFLTSMKKDGKVQLGAPLESAYPVSASQFKLPDGGILRADGLMKIDGSKGLQVETKDGVSIKKAQGGPGNLNVDGQINVGGTVHYPDGTTSRGRYHVTGPELLYVLNKAGMVIGKEWGGNGNLYVQGDAHAGSMSAGFLKTGGNIVSDGRMHITGGERLYLLNKDGVHISKAWGGNGNLNVEGAVKVNHGHGGWTDRAPLTTQAVNGKVGASFGGNEYWSHFPWENQWTYIRPGRPDTGIIIGDAGNGGVHIGNANAPTFNNSHVIWNRRHIDAYLDWGGKGSTLFAGWHTGKTVLGNYQSGGHDYALNLPANTVVSTNPMYVKDKLCINDACITANQLKTLVGNTPA